MDAKHEIKQTSIFNQQENLDTVLERGEKLDSLVDKSEALSSQARMFSRQSMVKAGKHGRAKLMEVSLEKVVLVQI